MAETAMWTVRVRLEHDEGRAMGPHLDRALTSDVRRLTHGFEDPDERNGPSTITLELAATTPDAARLETQYLLGKVRASAGLPAKELQVIWVAPLAPTPESSFRFREQAGSLFDDELYELAVVAAQIHLELHMTTLMQRFAEHDGGLFADALLSSRLEWNASQQWQRDLVEHLTGQRPGRDDFDQWKEYVAHLERRNAIVHRGQTVDRASARASIDAVDAFWAWLNDAAVPVLRRAQQARPDVRASGTATAR